MTAINTDLNTSPVNDGIRREHWGWFSITTATQVLVKTGAGVLKRIIVNSTNNGSYKVYNATTVDSDNVLSNTITPSTASVIEYNSIFNTGCFIAIGGTIDLTIIYG